MARFIDIYQLSSYCKDTTDSITVTAFEPVHQDVFSRLWNVITAQTRQSWVCPDPMNRKLLAEFQDSQDWRVVSQFPITQEEYQDASVWCHDSETTTQNQSTEDALLELCI